MIDPMRLKTQDGVRVFFEAFQIPMRETPGMPEDLSHVVLRTQLISEEALAELSMAYAARDRVAILDALTDAEYVIVGGYLVHGLPLPRMYEVAHDYCIVGKQHGAAGDRLSEIATLHSVAKGLQEYLLGCRFSQLERVRGGLDAMLRANLEAFCREGLWPVRLAAHAEVQRSNMSKLGEDGKPIFSAAGRVVKSRLYTRPDLAGVLQVAGLM